MTTIQKRSWWDKKYGKDRICAITRTRLRPGKNKDGMSRTVFLPCKHGFKRYALIQMIAANETDFLSCPLCRKRYYLKLE